MDHMLLLSPYTPPKVSLSSSPTTNTRASRLDLPRSSRSSSQVVALFTAFRTARMVRPRTVNTGDGWETVSTERRTGRTLHRQAQNYQTNINNQFTLVNSTRDVPLFKLEDDYARFNRELRQSSFFNKTSNHVGIDIVNKLQSADSVVCLGLGSLQSISGWRTSMLQLAFLEELLKVLKKTETPKYIQDPVFTELDKQFLTQMGYTVLETPDGFNRISEKTFVYAPHLENTHTQLALEKKPMAILCNNITVWTTSMLNSDLARFPAFKSINDQFNSFELPDSDHPQLLDGRAFNDLVFYYTKNEDCAGIRLVVTPAEPVAEQSQHENTSVDGERRFLTPRKWIPRTTFKYNFYALQVATDLARMNQLEGQPTGLLSRRGNFCSFPRAGSNLEGVGSRNSHGFVPTCSSIPEGDSDEEGATLEDCPALDSASDGDDDDEPDSLKDDEEPSYADFPSPPSSLFPSKFSSPSKPSSLENISLSPSSVTQDFQLPLGYSSPSSQVNVYNSYEGHEEFNTKQFFAGTISPLEPVKSSPRKRPQLAPINVKNKFLSFAKGDESPVSPLTPTSAHSLPPMSPNSLLQRRAARRSSSVPLLLSTSRAAAAAAEPPTPTKSRFGEQDSTDDSIPPPPPSPRPSSRSLTLKLSLPPPPTLRNSSIPVPSPLPNPAFPGNESASRAADNLKNFSRGGQGWKSGLLSRRKSM